MKNSSKVKYFGAVAAALLAVAPIAAPVVSQIASPAVTQAATTPGDNAVSETNVTSIKNVLNSAHGTTFGAANAQLLQLVQSAPLNSTASTPLSADAFFAGNGPAAGFFGSYASNRDAFYPNGTQGTTFKYSISGNGLDANSSQPAIINNINHAIQDGKTVTYTVTYYIYDANNNNASIGSFPFTATVTPSTTSQNLASGVFDAGSIQAGTTAPGSIDSLSTIQSAVSVKDASGKAFSLNANTDFNEATYLTSTTRPSNGAASVIAGASSWADAKQSLINDRKLLNSAGTQYINTGVFYQVLPLRNASSHVRTLVDSVKGAMTTVQSGYVNGSDLYYNATNDSLYLVRPILVTSSDTELNKPSVYYAAENDNSSAVQYFDGSTINLNSGDTATFNRQTNPDGTANLATRYATDTATAVNSLMDSSRWVTRQSGREGETGLATEYHVTQDDVRKAAVAAGVTFKSNDSTNTPDYYDYTNSKTFKVPVEAINADGLTSTVYITVTTYPAPADQQNAPVVELKQGVSKDITVQVGSNFQVNSLKDGLIVYTDSSKTAQLPDQYWSAAPTSVDTSKPGKTDVVWTFTNPSTGVKSTYTRTVTVVASDKTGFENTNGVISIQTSKAPQYTYDSASDSFKKADSYTQLKLASAWKYNQKATTTNGDVYYRVSANGYVKASDVTTAKVTPQFGVVTVNNDNGTKTYANTTKDSGAVQSIKPDTSWKFFAVAVNPDGSRAYLVADNQWIPASDVVERVQAASGVFTVGSDAAPTFNGSGSVVKGKTLKARSAWKVTGVKNINGQPYYRIATDLYVRADYGSYSK